MNISESPGVSPESSRGDGGGGRSRLLARGVEAGTWILLILTPLALGSVSDTATILMEGACFALLILAWWGRLNEGGSHIPRAFWGLSAAFVLWSLLQVVPLPPWALSWISPGTHRLYAQNLPGYASAAPSADLQAWLIQRKGSPSGGLAALPADRTGFEGKILVSPGWKPISWYPERTLRWVLRFLAYWACFVLVVDYLPERASRRRLPRLLLLLGFGISILGLIQHLTWNGKIYWVIKVYQGYPFGPWVNSNHFSGYLEMILPLAGMVFLQAAGQIGGRRRRRHSSRNETPRVALAFTALAGITAALLAADSRGGLFSLAITATLYFLTRMAAGEWRRKHPRLALLSAVIPLLLVLGFAGAYVMSTALRPAAVATGAEPSVVGRVVAWKGVLAMIASNPLSGTGLGTFALAYPPYKRYGDIGNWLQAHNDYLQAFAESGLVGFGLLAASTVLLLRRYLVPVLSSPWRRQDPVALGAALGITTLLVHSLVDFNLQIPSNGLLFVVVSGLLVRFHPPAASAPSGFKEGDQRAKLPETP